MRGLCDSYVIGNSLIMCPAVDKHLTQQIRYLCLISFDYVSLFIFLCVRDCKGLLIKLHCNSGEHVDLYAEYKRRNQSVND